MSPAQVGLLQRLIAADRSYRSRREAGETALQSQRGIEIGAFNGVDPRTARSLEDAGLAEAIDPGVNGRPFLFLGRYEPFDDAEAPTG